MPDAEHLAQRVQSVACAILTVSDTRTLETDGSGALIRDRLASAGHPIISYQIIPDEPSQVRQRVLSLCSQETCQAVLLSGGTGLALRDTTYEAITSLLDKRLDGFGELFRMLSYEQVGAAAMLSRATAGVCRSTPVFSMPGSLGAVALAMDKLILPEIGHLTALLGHA